MILLFSSMTLQDRAAVEQSIDEDLISALAILEDCYGIITLYGKMCPTFEEEAQRRTAFADMCSKCSSREMCRVFQSKHNSYKDTRPLVLERGVYVDQVQRYLCAGFSAHNLLILPFTKFTSLSLDQVVEVLESFKDAAGIDMALHKHRQERK